MPKVSGKKFVLVSIDDGDSDSRQTARNLRRYLASHKMAYICSSSSEEIKEYLDKLTNGSLTFHEHVDDQVVDEPLDTVQQTTKAATNQEILEEWASGLYSEGSDAIKLLFGTSSIEQESAHGMKFKDEQETFNTDIPQLFTVQSTEPETPNNHPENGKEEWQEQEMAFCSICDSQVRVGKNRNTRIRRQAQHVIDKHPKDEFIGVEIEKRYQCMDCKRMLHVSKSPCDHISEHHLKADVETEFRDLWTKEQVAVFNSVMEKCFERQLPVPRSRRIRNDTCIPAPKPSYCIVQGEDVIKINTLAEKIRTVAEKSNKEEDENGMEAGPSTAVDDDDVICLSDDDEFYLQIDDMDSDNIEMGSQKINHDKLENGSEKSTMNQY